MESSALHVCRAGSFHTAVVDSSILLLDDQAEGMMIFCPVNAVIGNKHDLP